MPDRNHYVEPVIVLRKFSENVKKIPDVRGFPHGDGRPDRIEASNDANVATFESDNPSALSLSASSWRIRSDDRFWRRRGATSTDEVDPKHLHDDRVPPQMHEPIYTA